MVRQRSAKPLSAGSIPAVASSVRLPVPPHFSFAATVESHGWYLLAPIRWDRATRVFRRPEAIGNKVFDLEISFERNAIEVAGAPDSNRRIKVLQTSALPLGYTASIGV